MGRSATAGSGLMIAALGSAIWSRRGARVSLALLFLIALLSLAAPLIAPQNPADPLGFDPAAANRPPDLSWTYLLGSDQRGRSVLALVLWGGRVSLPVSLGSALFAAALGLAIGLLAAVRGGIVDALLGRALDLLQAVPPLLPALVLFTRVGSLNPALLIAVFALSGMAAPARIARAAAATAAVTPYMEAARATGIGGTRLVLVYLLREALPGTLVWAASATASFLALETGLDFLGLGLDLTTVSWGTSLVGAQDALIVGNWWWLLCGGAAPALAALSLSTLAAALAQAMTDPTASTALAVGPGYRRSAVARDEPALDLAVLRALYAADQTAATHSSSSAARVRRWMLPGALLLLAVVAILGGALHHRAPPIPPNAEMLLRRAAAYAAQPAAPSYIATVRYDADSRLLRDAQLAWAARQPCPPVLHATVCAHADVQLWFSQGQARALTEGGTFVCDRSHTWGLNPMAGLATSGRSGCTWSGPLLADLGFTAGTVQALLPPPNSRRGAQVTGQEVIAGRRCWQVLLPPAGRACIDTESGLALQVQRLDHAGLPVASLTTTAIAFHVALAQELFANPIPGGKGPLIDGLSQPLLNIQAADDQALFTSLVPTYIPSGLTAQTPTFDSFYNSAHGYALEQRVRQAYQDQQGRPALVIIETLPGSGWDDVPRTGPAHRVWQGTHLQIWAAHAGQPATVRIEAVGTAAIVTSKTLPLSTLERVAAALQ